MGQLPFHPILVHFPIALSVLTPFVAAFLIWYTRGQGMIRGLWVLVILLQFFFVGGTFGALRSGQQDEEKVEHVVGENAMEHHEEAGERVLFAAVLALAAAAFVWYKPSIKPAQYLYLAIAVVAFGMTVLAGHSGGELVYEKGAATAHSKAGCAQPDLAQPPQGK